MSKIRFQRGFSSTFRGAACELSPAREAAPRATSLLFSSVADPRPCRLRSSRLAGVAPRSRGEGRRTGKAGRGGGRNEPMEKREVEYLKERVPCAAVLEKASFTVDVKESTRRAVKYRRGADIIIVIHEGMGWFDPLSDAKGDVFSLIRRLDGVAFGKALARAAELVGFAPSEPAWTRSSREWDPPASLSERWRSRRKPWPGSVRDERFLPDVVLRAAIQQDRLREGPHGSMWAAHVDDEGAVTCKSDPKWDPG